MKIELEARKFPMPSELWAVKDLEAARAQMATTRAEDAVAFVFVSLKQFKNIERKFQTQHRFVGAHLAGLHGMLWDGAIVLPHASMGDDELAFAPIPAGAGLVYV